eukprot:CAMPEP_0197860472 /NCGR_PEP_ID=MMETSP1438-20131217/35863_1 /TAXON_ID=1461541 /ORGANISM="Pterosperma sp., Strain CCMP1384" /LENGTH=214 /DNA_ID=CAMNT_0043477347 /DNA_START=251 /DNA_END=892 /DNA_ORIENTATION=-
MRNEALIRGATELFRASVAPYCKLTQRGMTRRITAAAPIKIINDQRDRRIDRAGLTYQLNVIRNILGVEDYALGLMITTNEEMKKINRKYRKKDEPTDIVALPVHEDLDPRQPLPNIPPELKDLGDIIVSLPYIESNCASLNVPLEEEFPFILTHGILHLMGHDHEEDDEAELMEAKEEEVKELFWRQLAEEARENGGRHPSAFYQNEADVSND